MLKSMFLAAAVVATVFAAVYATGGCTPLAAAPDAGGCPTVVTTHVVDDGHCAPLELVLDSGVSKHVCLTASQLDRAITEMP